jgi:uncharacterized protein (DUF2141 family)
MEMHLQKVGLQKVGLATLILTMAITSTAYTSSTATLTVNTIEDSTRKGVVRIALWHGEEGFPKGKPFRVAAADMTNGKATAAFNDLEPGDYAVSAFYDKNNDGKLDTNMVGKPTEPYGFSNDARGTFGPPKYQEARFTVTSAGQTVTVHLK